jgi:hypothetical protein
MTSPQNFLIPAQALLFACSLFAGIRAVEDVRQIKAWWISRSDAPTEA